MSPSSSPSELFGSSPVDAEVSDVAVLRAMLDFERALAEANAAVGLIPPAAAEAIAAVCDASRYDVAELGRGSESAGNPAVPLVRAMSALLPETARPWVHLGATSQDVVDTALMLCVQRSSMPLHRMLLEASDACAGLARTHRRTLMAARTLGQQALPTTFGLYAARWLEGLRLCGDVSCELQFGGAAGTLAGSGQRGLDVAEFLGRRLVLDVPELPWHTDRWPIRRAADELAGTVVTCGKIALDVTLLAQTELGELSEGTGGGSSALPHKQNPVDSVLIVAAARRVPGLLVPLYGLHELDRATGAWHAEWEPLRELVRLTGSVLSRTVRLVTGLRVHPDRMRANLDPRVMAESVASRLAPALGRSAAHELVARLSRGDFREALVADAEVRTVLSVEEIDATLEPTSWLGSVDALIDRALDAYEGWR